LSKSFNQSTIPPSTADYQSFEVSNVKIKTFNLPQKVFSEEKDYYKKYYTIDRKEAK